MNANKPPTRNTNEYEDLTRSVLINHKKAEEKKPEKHVNTNVLGNFLRNNALRWIISYIKNRFGPKHSFNTYEGSADKGIYPLQSKNNSAAITLALAADWATDTIESKNIGSEIEKHHPDYTVNMGDTYYVGNCEEIKNNFTPDNSFWHYGSAGSFSLVGNHEMYSNGYSYFDLLLPWMGIFHPQRIAQKTSFFCLENDHWRIIGLDTGYRSVGIPIIELLFSKADLRPQVLDWLKNDLKIAEDNRGLILLTHHQYASSFDKKTYPATAKQLAKIISEERKVLWFWGHEHRFSMYGSYSIPGGITAYGRCIGHGGMPVSLFDETKKKLKESNLVLYDNRFCKQVGETKVGHNGYSILTIEENNLKVDYYDEKDLLVTEQWQYNKTKQMIEGKSIINHCPDLNLHQNISQAIQ